MDCLLGVLYLRVDRSRLQHSLFSNSQSGFVSLDPEMQPPWTTVLQDLFIVILKGFYLWIELELTRCSLFIMTFLSFGSQIDSSL